MMQHGDLRSVNQSASASSALLLAGAVCLLALPSAVLAFSSRLDTAADAANQGLGAFAPGSIDPRLARALAARPPGTGPLFRFTPAGLATRPDRSVTVAVRVDSETAHEIIVRAPAQAPRPASSVVPLRITPTAYNLGLSHGYQGFTLSADPRKGDQIDLSGFNLTDGNGDPSPRLAPHIQLGQTERPGRAPRTLEGQGEQTLDVGGSYRLTPRIDVTAGVRYSQDRDRLKPLSDGKQDSQAVFVGTQFKF